MSKLLGKRCKIREEYKHPIIPVAYCYDTHTYTYVRGYSKSQIKKGNYYASKLTIKEYLNRLKRLLNSRYARLDAKKVDKLPYICYSSCEEVNEVFVTECTLKETVRSNYED